VSLLKPGHLTNVFQKNGEIPPRVVTAFRTMIYAHYRSSPRPMPWRETGDPYRILVSEVMLQQTQVERVKLKYTEFLMAFPTAKELATAPLPEVLGLWQGLGYNRRAIALKRCAEQIMSRFNGCFPVTASELESLPGIGPYTARAVAAFAFGIAEPLIETNIRTVFIHFFFHGQEKVNDREILPLVERTLDHDNPRDWYYALMDYGVMLKQTLPNPGRRSRHHTQQSRFEGSNRQLRSRILREIMKQPGIALVSLLTMLVAKREAVELNLVALQREGFLIETESGFRVAGEKNEDNTGMLPSL